MLGRSAAVDDIGEIFARYLKHLRTAAGLSFSALAGKSGVQKDAILRAEHGGTVTLPNAVRIAGALGVPIGLMLQPPPCDSCLGMPPEGFTCNTCGTAAQDVAA